MLVMLSAVHLRRKVHFRQYRKSDFCICQLDFRPNTFGIFSNPKLTNRDMAPKNAPIVLQITSSVSAIPTEQTYWVNSMPTLSRKPASVVTPILITRRSFRGNAFESVNPNGKKRKTFISISR